MDYKDAAIFIALVTLGLIAGKQISIILKKQGFNILA